MRIFNRAVALVDGVKTDGTFRCAGQYLRHGKRSLPSATGRYFLQKVPVVHWLPNYSLKWIINDIIAGLTIGVLIVPQALVYAKIAGIPLQEGLLASWLPSALYFFRGLLKVHPSSPQLEYGYLTHGISDISTGPTSIIGLLTFQIIKDISTEGFSPSAIAVSIAFSVGIYALGMGLLKLGFLLDFVSLPVLTGFVSAAALTIIIGQIPALFGEANIKSGVANQIHDILAKLPQTKPLTFAVGFSGIVLLVLMQSIGKRWGSQYKATWVISTGRNAIILILFTSISFAINKNLKKPLFDVNQHRSIWPRGADSSRYEFALEHVAIAKSFGSRNGYAIDQSQELTFLGVSNILNSIFGGMAVGGAFSRAAINSESGVKSPLSGVSTAWAVLLSIYTLTGALFWIPIATLSAVIVVAVWQIVVPPAVFYKYWETSLVDFTASMIAFWTTLFVSAEVDIEAAVAFMVIYTLLRNVFTKVIAITSSTFNTVYPSDILPTTGDTQPTAGVQILRFNESITYLNAYRSKSNILDTVKSYNTGVPSSFKRNADRLWSDQHEEHIRQLRQKAKMSPEELRRIHVVILDFSSVAYIDTTGLQALTDTKQELRTWGGENLEFRLVGMSKDLRNKFKRSEWVVSSHTYFKCGFIAHRADVGYDLVSQAVIASFSGSRTVSSFPGQDDSIGLSSIRKDSLVIKSLV